MLRLCVLVSSTKKKLLNLFLQPYQKTAAASAASAPAPPDTTAASAASAPAPPDSTDVRKQGFKTWSGSAVRIHVEDAGRGYTHAPGHAPSQALLPLSLCHEDEGCKAMSALWYLPLRFRNFP